MSKSQCELRQFHHIAIAAQDVDKSAEFYIKLLGCQVMSRPDMHFSGISLINVCSGVRVEIIGQKSQKADMPQCCINYEHICFNVKSLDMAQDILLKHKMKFETLGIHAEGDKKGQVVSLLFKDPDENMIKLMEESDDKQNKRFDECVKLRSGITKNEANKREKISEIQAPSQKLIDLEESATSDQSFLPLTRLRYLVHSTTDIEKTCGFYVDFLGFKKEKLPNWSCVDGIFLVNSNIGFNMFLVPCYHRVEGSLRPVVKGAPALSELGQQISFSVSDLSKWKECLQQKKVEFCESLLPKLNVRCLYAKDPDGYRLELRAAEDDDKAKDFLPPKEYLDRVCELQRCQSHAIMQD